MAKDRTTVQAPDPGVGQPPQLRSADIALVEIAKIQSDGEHLKRDLGETRTDMKDMRDRMARLEVRVDHLPSKGFITTVVTIGISVLVAAATLIPKIQAALGITH